MQELNFDEIEEVSGGNMPEGSVGGDTTPPGMLPPDIFSISSTLNARMLFSKISLQLDYWWR